MQSIGIKGIGYYAPENVFTNFDFEKTPGTSDEWIRTRTGIVERRFASKDQATSDLATEASLKAIKNAKISKEDVEKVDLSEIEAIHFASIAIQEESKDSHHLLLKKAKEAGVLICSMLT